MVTNIQIWRDIDAEVLCMVNRFKNLAVHCVISVDGFSRPSYVQDLTLGRIELHVPQLSYSWSLFRSFWRVAESSCPWTAKYTAVSSAKRRTWEWIWSGRSMMLTPGKPRRKLRALMKLHRQGLHTGFSHLRSIQSIQVSCPEHHALEGFGTQNQITMIKTLIYSDTGGGFWH